MAVLSNDADRDEAALKWIALAVLHGIDGNAKEISLETTTDGAVRVMAEYRDSELPAPTKEIGARIVKAFREITHIEGAGETHLLNEARNPKFKTVLNNRVGNCRDGMESITSPSLQAESRRPFEEEIQGAGQPSGPAPRQVPRSSHINTVLRSSVPSLSLPSNRCVLL